MKRFYVILCGILLVGLTALTLGGCGLTGGNGEGQYIIEAKEVPDLLAKGGTVLVDMREAEDYQAKHIQGAVNITRNDIVINEPVSNMLAPQDRIETVLGKSGIDNNTLILIYDQNNNMDAARLWWTLKVYGHEAAKVISGGFPALEAAGLAVTDQVPAVKQVNYQAKAKDSSMIATLDEVKSQVENPGKNVVILDTRTSEEYNEGRIPGAVLLDYQENNFPDGTYKPVQHIKIQYLEAGVKPEQTVILYCKTSVRAAQTYLALYNAGYRNLKVYDGAWLEWTLDPARPVDMPADKPAQLEPSTKDMS